ncbi:hypothetical protein KJI95_19340 [Shewanella sp. JM162201]|uniref:Uncharacterized protein n=3 Tax=Shewanella TaxID=22 RepID=A0AAJ1EXW2_9GAMM|nr:MULTISPECIES: hypothetical protein [Shewanella]MBT1446650.1 hypothetical protein [Shewanella jiangmenensis]MCH4294419.1 hypothetical protein [Shewanella zhuhaiensis]MCH4294424.1 hypothetical protein [Shewanella zhuhaiensis]
MENLLKELAELLERVQSINEFLLKDIATEQARGYLHAQNCVLVADLIDIVKTHKDEQCQK